MIVLGCSMSYTLLSRQQAAASSPNLGEQSVCEASLTGSSPSVRGGGPPLAVVEECVNVAWI